MQGSGVILGSAGQSDFYSPLLPLFSGYTKIRNSELGPVLLKFALFNGLRPLVKNVIFCSVSTAHWNMWNCAYQIYPRTIKVVSILSKLIFLDLKPCFFEKRVSKEISYIVYISAILPNIVYISLVSLKKISLRPAPDQLLAGDKFQWWRTWYAVPENYVPVVFLLLPCYLDTCAT